MRPICCSLSGFPAAFLLSIVANAGTILEHGFQDLLDQDRLDDLSRLYRQAYNAKYESNDGKRASSHSSRLSCLCSLSARVHALDALCTVFKIEVGRIGSKLVLDEQNGDMVVVRKC